MVQALADTPRAYSVHKGQRITHFLVAVPMQTLSQCPWATQTLIACLAASVQDACHASCPRQLRQPLCTPIALDVFSQRLYHKHTEGLTKKGETYYGTAQN
eukprot:1136364-Pelagomonas_calceolata.AAC.1